MPNRMQLSKQGTLETSNLVENILFPILSNRKSNPWHRKIVHLALLYATSNIVILKKLLKTLLLLITGSS